MNNTAQHAVLFALFQLAKNDRPATVLRVVAETGAREVHLRAPGTVTAAGSSAGYDDGRRSVTSAEVLAEVMSALGR